MGFDFVGLMEEAPLDWSEFTNRFCTGLLGRTPQLPSCGNRVTTVIYSDNQTSLLRTSQALEAEYKKRKPEGIVWKMIVPHTLYQGERWERMVRSINRALLALGESLLLKEDEFLTLLARAADPLNSRPLTRNLKGDLSSFLTPNHFLVGRAETGLVGKVDDRSHLLVERYRKLEKHISNLWDRFLD
jgi:hypothetical protein